ncbi:Glutaredoxin [Neofusicoccum parvum]|uniref:Glutaredoxin n=1 Tax=Neofusicoccum parvum TaxID=310453 RepID=A0ACB5SPL9_9PEZI|nr:Glutaredoxin [Neofusicoccum parvum]
MFRKHAQDSTTSRSKAAPPTKYALTSKPHGVTKKKPRGRSPSTRLGLDRKQSALEHPFSTAFKESSKTTHKTLITTAHTALASTRLAHLRRLATTNGLPLARRDDDNPNTTSPSSASSPTSSLPAAGPSPADRLPTTLELQASHNALVASIVAPFGSETIVAAPPSGGDGARLADLMADLGATVEREERRLRDLGEQWGRVQAEIRRLGEGLLGGDAVRGVMRGEGVGGVVVEGAGLSEERVEALGRLVEEMGEEGLQRCERVVEGERAARKNQVRHFLNTMKMMEED